MSLIVPNCTLIVGKERGEFTVLDFWVAPCQVNKLKASVCALKEPWSSGAVGQYF